MSGAEDIRTSTAGNYQWPTDLDVISLDTRRQPSRQLDLSTIPKSFLRQIFGLNPFRTSYFALYRPLRDVRSRSILVCGIFCAIAAGVPLPIIGVIFGHIINSFPPTEQQLRKSISELLGVAVAYFVVTWGWAVCWGVVGERVSRGLRESMVERALGMELSYFEVEAPDITNRLTADTQAIQLGTSEKVGLFIQSISYFVTAFTVGFILNAKLTGILFAAVIPSMLIIVCLGTTFVSKLSKRASECTALATSVAEGAINAVQVVQAFNALGVLSDDHFRHLTRAVRSGVQKAIVGAFMLGGVYFVAYSANALAFWEGSRMIASQHSKGGAGTVYAVVFLIMDASFVVGQFGPFIQTFALAASAGGRVLSLLDHPEAHINVYSDEGKRAEEATFAGDISFHHVTFVYPARPTARVLDGVNLHFKAGTMTGIVGSSGSGKSTVASLLLRFYDPSSGKVTMDGNDIREYQVQSLRSHIALVDQDPVLFSGTILGNIKHGLRNSEHLTAEEQMKLCEQAARDANAYTFIKDLPEGFNTPIGSGGGTQLSGGQKQRICLARALISNPRLLILDEPTSALDATSEVLVLDALKRASSVSNRTTIMIAHRLATVRDADKIMCMGGGRLLEEGSHSELMSKEGAYRALVEAQMLDPSHELNPEAEITFETEMSRLPPGKIGDTERITAIEDSCSKAPQQSTSTIIRRCLQLSKPDSVFIVLGILGSILSGGIIIGEAIIFGHLIQLLNNTPDPDLLRSRADFYCLMFFVVALVALTAWGLSGSAFGVVSERLLRRTRDISLRTILRQDISWFSQPGHSSHTLMAMLNMDSGHLSGLSGTIIGTIFSVTTSIVGGIVLAHVVAWKIAIVLLAAVPVMLVAGFARLRVLSRSEQRHETAYNDAAALASEACVSIRTVASLGRERDVLRLYKEAVKKPYRESLKFIVVGNLFLAFALAITYFVYALAYWWGSRQVRSGRYTEQDFFIVLPALLFSAQAAGQMFSLAPEITRAKAAAASVLALHDQKPTINVGEISQVPDILQKSDVKSLQSYWHCSDSEKSLDGRRGHVEFRGVSFNYPTRPNTSVLDNLSFSIRAGEFVAFVGPSGAGKSSAVALLERFFDPTSGAILIDGEGIRDMAPDNHRERLSLVSQAPDLFAGSVAFNVGLGIRPGQSVTQEAIEKVCRSCGVHTFVAGLPDGYQTECGLNGSRLSGGQKQRIAIARALIRDPEILLLDEATSALDSHSEAEVQKAIEAAASDRTTIVVAHRLASVQKADRIFVFDHGRIVEYGKHDELIAFGGIYAGMVRAQALS